MLGPVECVLDEAQSDTHRICEEALLFRVDALDSADERIWHVVFQRQLQIDDGSARSTSGEGEEQLQPSSVSHIGVRLGITLPTRDLKRAAAFYAALLGPVPIVKDAAHVTEWLTLRHGDTAQQATESAAQVTRGIWYFSTESAPDFVVSSVEVRSFFPQELALLLGAGGLRLVERFGDFERSSFTSESPTQVCICEAA